MTEQATGATNHLRGAVGRATSLRRAITTIPGRGRIDVRQDKGTLASSPHRRDGRHARVAREFRRHSREVNGCQGKGAHVFVPRPRAMQTTGGRVGDSPQVIGVVNRRLSNSTHRGSDAGARAQLISSHRLPPMCRHFVPADAMFAGGQAATRLSMGPAPCHRRRKQS